MNREVVLRRMWNMNNQREDEKYLVEKVKDRKVLFIVLCISVVWFVLALHLGKAEF